ncbi:MAG: tRNA-(ms[2]io[6]A)-hydroxylase [Crocinitomicaceae bacterium]|nr:tRNA-(ms[2]io[6]A)-hydroxylase [Crocinitomicaceae bacterium]|tara:strand:+ start:4985 stop:5563 length:579 start_codon:yes stop_codon:yes gene_type:complete
MIFKLKYDTPKEWAIEAIKDIDSFLQDHADAERKVANMCLSLIAKYPNKHEIIDELIQISVEELMHFRQVHELIRYRGDVLNGVFQKDPYIKGLLSIVRSDSELLFMDRLIIASVAELRGSERFKLIGEVIDDTKISKFYLNLHKQELEHIDSFIKMAKIYFDGEVVNKRVDEILEQEAKVTESLPWRSAIH